MSKENTAVILARVSSKSQEDEGYSLDSQLKLLQNYCDYHEFQVVRVFKIAETASKEQGRKVFHELLRYITAEKVFHLAVEKTDRLTRNFRDAVAVDEWLEQDARRRLHAVKESLLLHKEAKSDVKFMWNIHLSVAKKYSDNLREEAMKGWAEKLAQGWLPASPPIGYKTVIENGKRVHVLDPTTAPIMRSMFECYIEPSQSVASIANEMKLAGITTSKGRPYCKSKVHNILTNPFYIGINRFNGREYPGLQEPLISKQLFDQVQHKMRRKLPTRYKKHNPVFKNLIRCGRCAGVVTWQLQKGRYYGTCQRLSEACKQRKLLREDIIEEQIRQMLHDLVSPSEAVLDWVVTAMRSRYKEQIDHDTRLKTSIQASIDRITRMERNLYDDKLAGEITHELYKIKQEELMQEKTDLQKQLSSINANTGMVLEKKIALFELSQKAADIYPNKLPEQKRSIISKLFSELTYDGGAVSVTYTNTARAIADKVRITRKLIGGAL